ncbi:MAG TPA: hypothetical protein VKV06_08150 [Acidimicrobiales bacterium]|nr:hypothetical protein [Acidimicrobiales bacterium]
MRRTAAPFLRPTVAIAAVATVAAAIARFGGAGQVVRFAIAGVALAVLAAVIGAAIEDVGEHLGPGATGLLQSTLGNLPELFVGIFALSDGLLTVVRAALIGSMLGNAVLVLGCAFVAGGLRHGTQRFDPEEPRLYGSLLLLAVAALLVPTLAHHLSTPAARHTSTLSSICAGVLLAVYACSVPYTLRRSHPTAAVDPEAAADSEATADPAPAGAESAAGAAPAGHPEPGAGAPVAGGPPVAGGDPSPAADALPRADVPPLGPSIILLVAASAGAAFVSEWFVGALEPAIRTLGLTPTFTGLVVVAIASNAVENAVGVRFAWRARPAFAVTTTLASPLQVALFLTPVLVLLSNFIGPSPLTLVFPTLLVVAVGISTVVVVSVVFDGEYTWIEGAALLGLYVMLASSFWWG